MSPQAAAHSLTPRLFAFTSVGLLLLALLLRPTQPIGLDIYFRATYFVVLHPQAIAVLAALFAVLAVAYWLAARFLALSEWLGRLHFVASASGALLLLFALQIFTPMPRGALLVFAAAFLLAGSTLLFPLSVLVGTLGKQKS